MRRRNIISLNKLLYKRQRQQKRLFTIDTKAILNKINNDNISESFKLKADKQKEQVENITFHDVKKAYGRIQGQVKKTEMSLSSRISPLVGCDLWLKKEHFSITGSYKERGALNKLLSLTPEERQKGVICSSAGNHAQAVSYHATRLGIDAIIVMPENTPFNKIDATRDFGAKIQLYGSSFADAYEKASKIADETGRIFIHAFNDPYVVAGQGTVALEIVEQFAYLDAVVVPVGGGGLLAGMAVALRHINPRIKIYGVEAEAMPGMHKSLIAGTVQSVTKQATMADGIAIENVGSIPFKLIHKYVDDIVLVNEDEIAESILHILELEKSLVEGSGATGVAALLTKKLNFKQDESVCAILTGGNIDMTLLGRVIERGMVKSGRLCRLGVTIPDAPGALARLTNIIARLRGNVRDVEHERAFLLASVGYTKPMITIETRDFNHIQEIIDVLSKAGYKNVTLMTPEP